MQIGFSTNAFREHGLEETIDVLGEAGYDGVEILLDDPHLLPETATDADLDRLRAQLDEYDLAVPNCNAFMFSAGEVSDRSREATFSRETEDFHHPSFVELDPDDRQTRIDHTKACLETAAAIGAPSISVPPGGPVPRRKSDADALDELVEGLAAVAGTAEEVGVDVLIEPEPELLIETSDDFLALMERVDSPRVACNFDAGHFYCVGEDPAELVDKLADYTRHYHVEDIPADRTHEHTQLGDGAMDIDGFLETVEATGYDGFVTVELYPYGATAAETARGAMAYLREHGWV